MGSRKKHLIKKNKKEKWREAKNIDESWKIGQKGRRGRGVTGKWITTNDKENSEWEKGERERERKKIKLPTD